MSYSPPITGHSPLPIPMSYSSPLPTPMSYSPPPDIQPRHPAGHSPLPIPMIPSPSPDIWQHSPPPTATPHQCGESNPHHPKSLCVPDFLRRPLTLQTTAHAIHR